MFDKLFFEPVYNILTFFLNISPYHDVGIAIILTTILIKFLLLPINLSSQKSSYLIKEIQPEIEKLKELHKKDKQTLSLKIMSLYKEKKINIFSTFFSLLIQIPIFLALFFVFKTDIKLDTDSIYSFIKFPEEIKTLAFGLFYTSEKYWWMGVLTGVSMYIYSKRQASSMVLPKIEKGKSPTFQETFAKNMQVQIVYVFPVLSGVAAAVLPSALGIYWTVSNIINIIQDIYIKNKLKIKN